MSANSVGIFSEPDLSMDRSHWITHATAARVKPLPARNFTDPPEMEDHAGIVGLAAGICTSISLLPQLVKLVRDKKAEDISLFYLLILFAGLALWIWYGVLRDDLPILLTNGFSLVLNGVVIALGIRYKKAHRDKPGGI